MQIVAVNLIEALEKNGVDDREKIKEIVESFLFSYGSEFDGYYVRENNDDTRKMYPFVGFRNTESIKEATEIVIPDGEDSFHETMPFGVAESLFDKNSDALDFIHGNNYGEENIKDVLQ